MIQRNETYVIGGKFIDRVLLNHQPINTNVTRISIPEKTSMELTSKPTRFPTRVIPATIRNVTMASLGLICVISSPYR